MLLLLLYSSIIPILLTTRDSCPFFLARQLLNGNQCRRKNVRIVRSQSISNIFPVHGKFGRHLMAFFYHSHYSGSGDSNCQNEVTIDLTGKRNPCDELRCGPGEECIPSEKVYYLLLILTLDYLKLKSTDISVFELPLKHIWKKCSTSPIHCTRLDRMIWNRFHCSFIAMVHRSFSIGSRLSFPTNSNSERSALCFMCLSLSLSLLRWFRRLFARLLQWWSVRAWQWKCPEKDSVEYSK